MISYQENTLYKCEACDRMFLDILKLNNHRKRVHKIPTFKCQLCSKSFDDRKGFIQHQSRVHKVKVLAQPNQLTFFVSDNRDHNSQFFCKKCEEYLVFESATDLRVHNATIHGDEAKYWVNTYFTKSCNVRYGIVFGILGDFSEKF